MQKLILIGLSVGVVVSVLLRIYFRFAVFPQKPKGPVFVLWWCFYVGVIVIAAIMSSEIFEHRGKSVLELVLFAEKCDILVERCIVHSCSE